MPRPGSGRGAIRPPRISGGSTSRSSARSRKFVASAGRYANVSVFDVASPDELHELLGGLPLFPYMDIKVTALARHPSALDAG